MVRKSETSIETLERNARAANAALAFALNAERDRENRALIGKTFKYRNNYSVPEKPSDYWWSYARVERVRSGYIEVFDFQTDKNGKITIAFKETLIRLLDGHQPISKREFAAAYRRLMKKLQAQNI